MLDSSKMRWNPAKVTSTGSQLTRPPATAFGSEIEEMMMNHNGYSTAMTTAATSTQMMMSTTQSPAVRVWRCFLFQGMSSPEARGASGATLAVVDALIGNAP